MDAKHFMQLKVLKKFRTNVTEQNIRKLVSRDRDAKLLFEEDLDDSKSFEHAMQWFVVKGYFELFKGYMGGGKPKYKITKKGQGIVTGKVPYKTQFRRGKETVLYREKMAFDFEESLAECLGIIYDNFKKQPFKSTTLLNRVKGEMCFDKTTQELSKFHVFIDTMLEKGYLEITLEGYKLTKDGLKLANITASGVSHYSPKELVEMAMQEIYKKFNIRSFNPNEFKKLTKDILAIIYFEGSWKVEIGDPNDMGKWLLDKKYLEKSGKSIDAQSLRNTKKQNYRINFDKWTPPKALTGITEEAVST